MMSMDMYVHSHLINNGAFHGSNICIYIYRSDDESFSIFDLFKNEIDKTKKRKMASPVQ
jgi:hypothetical protein